MKTQRVLAVLLSVLCLIALVSCKEEPSEPISSHLNTLQLQEIEDYLNDPVNRSFIPQETHSVQYPITVLGGEIDNRNRLLITYADADLGVRPYLLTLEKSDDEYRFLSDVKIDDNIINTLFETALSAHENAPENERFIGDLQPETLAVCRMDDGKYYQIYLHNTYDAILVFVSQEELPMSATWDWILIGDRTSFSIDNLGKLMDSGKANCELPQETLLSIEKYLNEWENNGFISNNYYTSPDKIDLSLVFYDGAGIHKDFTEWSSIEKQDILSATNWEAFFHSPIKIPSKEANNFLIKKCGLSLETFLGGTIPNFFYSEKYDAYYIMHGDINYSPVTVLRGEIDNTTGNYRLTYTFETQEKTFTVTLRKSENGYQFISNEIVKVSL